MALESVKEAYGDKFSFELDDDNFCILFKNKLNPENIGKMYLQNRYQCMLSYGPDINTDKVGFLNGLLSFSEVHDNVHELKLHWIDHDIPP